MHIRDAVTIVTGSSGGIGLAIARELSARGAKVVLAARSKETLEQLEKEISGSLAIPVDLREDGAAQQLIAQTVKAFGRVDILINNAGQGLRASIEQVDLEEYRSIMELNVFAVLRAMQAVIPVMRAQGGGTILNIGSLVSKNYFPELGAYASTKYALNALSLTARTELATDSIVVSVFHPKMTATDFGINALGEKYQSSAGRPGMSVDTAEEVARHVADQVESGEPEASM